MFMLECISYLMLFLLYSIWRKGKGNTLVVGRKLPFDKLENIMKCKLGERQNWCKQQVFTCVLNVMGKN
jgi:hypothetical protein